MPTIRLLDDRLISQIAAGEVVERPASVVKELIENALDAGATAIDIELEAGGKQRIVVSDDGVGMDADDALLAFDRHATSKISSYHDLENVATLGFRGEALATIAAVARVELSTATAPGEGQKVRIEGGRVISAAPFPFRRGSRIEASSLFFNVPARRKFLKSPEAELRRAVEVVQGYALACPDVRFTLRQKDRVLLEALPSGQEESRRERIAQIFGRDLAKALIEIPLEFVGEDLAISGFIGRRETVHGRRIFTYVNRRLVRDRALMARFYRCVREEWQSEDIPALFLFVDILPDQVDVNVHPQKAEVRFRQESTLDRIEAALRQTLSLARAEEPARLAPPRHLPSAPASWEGLGGRFEQRRDPVFANPSAGDIREMPSTYDPSAPLPANPTIARPSFESFKPSAIEVSKSPISGRGKQAVTFRLLGQYKASLILLEGPDGLYLIDQHAAHERLLYERLRRAFLAREMSGQRLIQPLLIELAPSESLRLQASLPALEACAFEIAILSGGTVALSSLPADLEAEQAAALLEKLATSDGEPLREVEEVRRRLLEEVAAERSCKAAIKIHRPLRQAEMETLISELFAAEQPYTCPHGRPTVLQLNDAELERRFGRRG